MMGTFRRMPTSGIVMVIVALVLAACGSSAAPTSQATPTVKVKSKVAVVPTPTAPATTASCSSKATKLAFWTSFTAPDVLTLAKMVDTYNKQNPAICVDMVQVPGAETDVAKLMTAVRGGTGPDVYHLDRFTVAERAATGILEDLSKYVPAGYGSNYLPFAWKEVLYKGKPYGLPFDTDARALYYRSDVLKAAGVDTSVLNPAKGPPTVAEIRSIAEKVDKKDSGGNYTRVGFIPWWDQGWHYTWGYDFGGTFFDPATCKVTPTDPGVVKAFQTMFWDWAGRMGPQKVQTFISSYAPPNAPPQTDVFVTGRLAMEVTGDWRIRDMREYAPKAQYGITYIPVPAAGDKPSTWSGGWSFVIPTGAKHPQQAFNFMKWMTGPQGQRMYVQGTAHMATWKPVLSDKSLFTGRHAFFADNLLPVAKSRPPLPVGARYWDALTTAQDDVTLHRTKVIPALQGVYNQVQSQLQSNCPLK